MTEVRPGCCNFQYIVKQTKHSIASSCHYEKTDNTVLKAFCTIMYSEYRLLVLKIKITCYNQVILYTEDVLRSIRHSI